MRSGIALVGLLLCMGACAFGWNYLYDKRRMLGTALIGAGALCGLAGMGLLVSSVFPGTRTWWL